MQQCKSRPTTLFRLLATGQRAAGCEKVVGMKLLCPCGLDRDYDDCCCLFHDGDAQASNAEQLMRSRYSAFAVGDEAYLARTWATATRPERIVLVPGQTWTRLEVLDTVGGGVLAREGVVEFRAHYERDGEPGTLHERSAFAREKGQWVYVGPVPVAAPSVA